MPVRLEPENRRYIEGSLRYEKDRLVEEDGRPVMLECERGISGGDAGGMDARDRCRRTFGSGRGFIDEASQRLKPAGHHIREPNRDVYAKGRRDGWLRRRGVVVHHDFWQRVIDDLPRFDAIYFDTWEDSVEQFRALVKRLPKLLNPDGLFSWFNHPVNPDLHDCVVAQGFEISRQRVKVKPPPKSEQGAYYYFESRMRNYDIVLARRAPAASARA